MVINDQHWVFLKKKVYYLGTRKKKFSFVSCDKLNSEGFLNYLLANYAFLNFELPTIRS
jgi:hypothetical protein